MVAVVKNATDFTRVSCFFFNLFPVDLLRKIFFPRWLKSKLEKL